MNNYDNITDEEKKKMIENLNEEIEKTRILYENSLNDDMIGDLSLASKMQSLTKEKMNLSKSIFSSNKKPDDLISIDKLVDINQNSNENIEVLNESVNLDNETKLEKLARIKNEIQQLQKQYYNGLDENLIGNNEIETKIHEKRKELQDLLESKAEQSKVEEPTEKVEEQTLEIEPVENDNQIKFDNIRVIFNGEKGLWEIHFLNNNEEKIELFSLDKTALFKDKCIELDKEIITNYGLKTSSEIDYNLYLIFSEFDKKYSTNLKDDYLNNNLSANIIYDFRKMYKASKELLNHSQKRALRKIAKEQEEFKNANIIKFNTKKAATLLVGASLAAGVIGAAVSNNTNINKDPNVTTEKHIENTIEEPKSEEYGPIDKPDLAIQSSEEQIDTLKKEDTTEILNDDKKEFIGPENYGANILRVHDKMNLSDVTLRYTSQGANPYVNVDNLNCAYYKISLIAILRDGRVYKAIEVNDEFMNSNLLEIQERYQKQLGGNITMQVNFNGYDKNDNMIYKNIGWTAVEEVKVKNGEKEEDEKNRAK